MSAIKVTLVLSTILITSVPANYAIISFLNQKPLGNQTALDTVHSDLFWTNLIFSLLICFSCITVAIYGPLGSPIAFVLAWSTLFLAFTLLGTIATAFIMRFLYILYLKDLEEFDDWLLIYMARATSTLPASLFLAQFWRNNAANPFQDYLMTFKRSEENEMETWKTALFYFILAISMLTILLSYLNMKENIRFLTPQVKHFTNQNKSFSSPSSQDGSIEYLHEDLQRKIITILLFDIFLVSSLHHADYPQSLDYQSLQFYLGVFYMGTVLPLWIICAHHEIFSFVSRRTQRIWPLCSCLRLKTSQGPNRA